MKVNCNNKFSFIEFFKFKQHFEKLYECGLKHENKLHLSFTLGMFQLFLKSDLFKQL